MMFFNALTWNLERDAKPYSDVSNVGFYQMEEWKDLKCNTTISNLCKNFCKLQKSENIGGRLIYF